MSDVLISVRDLRKEFRLGFWMRRVQAVQGISFEVKRGDIFGFLGPNGAGKTTTIKVLTGLISPSGGHAELFGEAVPSTRARQRLGFLPENPYVYPYLTPREFVELSGRLSGLSGRDARQRAVRCLEQTGVLYAADRPVRKLSKGMLQRTGLAAALVGDPELLILDEPMSGLDPVGRKQVRDLIFEERRRGRTIFFSTHILSDVETICDRVTILRSGVAVVSGRLDELLRRNVARVALTFSGDVAALAAELEGKVASLSLEGGSLLVEVEGGDQVSPLLRRALELGVEVTRLEPRSESLEELFVREAFDTSRPVDG